ncbi:hypothetical protein Tco_1360933 [Tanacetum coccineum]
MSSDSAVTYTSVHSEARSWSIPSEDPYEEAARQLLEQAPRPSEYVPDPMELEDHVPVYIPEPEHPEDLVPAEDEAPIEPYITEPWLRGELHEEDPEEDDDEDPEEDPANGGDDGDDEDKPSDDDEDEEVDIKANDEEEEHLAPIDSTDVALLVADQAPSAEETKLFETDESAATPPPHPAYRVTARISILAPVPTPVWSDTEVARLLAISTPPSSLLSPWSSPLPQIPFPPLPLIPSLSLPLSPPLPVSAPPPASPIRPLGYRAVMIWLRAEAASTSHSLPLPPLSPKPAPTSSPQLLLPFTNRREDRPEGTSVVTDVAAFSQRMTEFETRVRQDTDEIYTRLDDEQSERQLMTEVMSLHTHVVAQQAVIIELQATDRKRQAMITEMLAADRRRQKQFIEALKLLKRL